MTTISKVNGCRLVGVGTDPDIRWAVFFTLYTKNHLGGYESFVGKFIERFGLSNRFVQYAYHKGRRRVYLLIVLPAPESREEELKWWGTFMSVVRRSPEVGSIELSRANVSGYSRRIASCSVTRRFSHILWRERYQQTRSGHR